MVQSTLRANRGFSRVPRTGPAGGRLVPARLPTGAWQLVTEPWLPGGRVPHPRPEHRLRGAARRLVRDLSNVTLWCECACNIDSCAKTQY